MISKSIPVRVASLSLLDGENDFTELTNSVSYKGFLIFVYLVLGNDQ